MTEQEHLDNLMDWFDFQKVALTMQTLEWKWKGSASDDGEIPNEADIRQYVRKYARRAMSEALTNTGHAPGKGFHSSGGFHIEAEAKDGEIDMLYCRFTVTEWCTD